MCVCVCERERASVRAMLCACVVAMLCNKMFANFYVLYACMLAHCMFFFKFSCKAL